MSITITKKNIDGYLKKAKEMLDAQMVEGIYPRRFFSIYGTGRLEGNGKIVWDSWDNPPLVLTKKDI